jgi:uncharacterized protein
MELSKHNIYSAVHGTNDVHFIVNLLSGNADLLSTAEMNSLLNGDAADNPDFIPKGYIVDPVSEEKEFRRQYLNFLDTRDTDEVQLFYVPSYACNFGCSYCYQTGYTQVPKDNGMQAAGEFFRYINSCFVNRKKYITLFGGEPLPGGKHSIEYVKNFVGLCNNYQLPLAIVTNGYALAEYLPVLTQADIREIQITLDGPEDIHNQRRPLKGGGKTFNKIAGGIDAALKAGLPVNLRVVLDRENIGSLPKLAEYAISQGWTRSPLFKTQLGRNYELHYCQSQQSRLYSRIDLYRDLYHLILQHPQLTEFHKPSFSVSKFLFENGELPSPLFDSCPGCKTEWAFDYTGKIYACTATVGKPGEAVGEFFPEITLNQALITSWQQRDVLAIDACKTCNLQLACGGGCASVAANSKGSINAPDCRPVKELLELGMSLYNCKVL